MRVLGLSSFDHDTAAVLLEDGKIKAGIENDKLARARTRGMPEAATRFCITSSGGGWHDLDFVVVAMRPLHCWWRQTLLRARLSLTAPLTSAYHELTESGMLARDLNDLRILWRLTGARQRVVSFEHHLCHASSAFFPSPFDHALILIMDEHGEGYSGMLAVGEGNRIRVLHRLAFPNSPAFVFSQVTELIGFLPHQEEHKTQWLSLEGDPLLKEVLLETLRKPGSLWPTLNLKYFNRGLAGRLAFSRRFYERTGLPLRPEKLTEDQRKALASSIQETCTLLITELIQNVCHQQGISHVCLAGGLFQNPILVSSLEKYFGMEQLFVPPAPGNSGTALGAAYLAWHQILNRHRLQSSSDIYLGPKFSRQEIKDILDNCKTRHSSQDTEERKLDAAVQRLQAGNIVAWFQGASEFGPRALGNRSLLASPWAPYVKENLNDYIKYREWFRPFAISVTAEDCPQFFEASRLCRFMNSLGWMLPRSSCLPEWFSLPGNRVRLHVVEKHSNPLYWRLLRKFGDHAPAPILINTSFNLFGEPLVVTPRDAIRSYFCSGIDSLIIDNFVLSKSAVRFPYVSPPESGIRLEVPA